MDELTSIMSGSAVLISAPSVSDGVRKIMMDFPTGGIAMAIGVALLFAYRYYPEKFPSKLTARAIRWRAILLIGGGLLLSIWDTLRRLR